MGAGHGPVQAGCPLPPHPVLGGTRGQMALLGKVGGVLLWGDQGVCRMPRQAWPHDRCAPCQRAAATCSWSLPPAWRDSGVALSSYTGGCDRALFGVRSLGTWHADALLGALLLRPPGASLAPQAGGHLTPWLGHPPGRSPRRPGQASRVPALCGLRAVL